MERHGIARMRLVRTQRVVVCAPFSFSFFFFIFFLFSLFFLLLFPLPLPLLLSLLPIPLTDSNRSPRGAPVLPPVLRCQSENSSFCLLAPSSPPHLPDSTSHRFATLSSLLVSSRFAFGFFGLSLPPLLPLLNNCPPRGEDGTRLLRDLGHPPPPEGSRDASRCTYPLFHEESVVGSRNTFSFVSDRYRGIERRIRFLFAR